MILPSLLSNLKTNAPITIGIVLLDNFSMMALSSVIEPIRALNRLLGEEIFKWNFISPDNQPISASNNALISPDGDFNSNDYDCYIITGGFYNSVKLDKELKQFLINCNNNNKVIISLSGSTYLLVETGIMENKKCTIHWEYLDVFREEYPYLDITDNLYEIDGNIITISGGDASFDFISFILENNFGLKVVNKISEQFLHSQYRSKIEQQRDNVIINNGIYDETIVNVITTMKNNIEHPIKIRDIADKYNISIRHIERMFNKYLSIKPSIYYLDIRLEQSKKYLQNSTMKISDIAIASGFNSFTSFSRSYKKKFGYPPRDERLNKIEKTI